MARMCAGVVPQQPPTKLTSPCSANSPQHVRPCAPASRRTRRTRSGRPAFGCALTNTGATRESSWTYWRSAWAPSAQLSPTLSGRACATECQNASVVCPESVRPLASVMVPEIITGSRTPEPLEHVLDREDRGLGVQGVEDGLDQEQVGAAVDQAARAPRRRSPTSSSNVTLRKPGSLTSGESEARAVGRAQHAGDEPGRLGCAPLELVGRRRGPAGPPPGSARRPCSSMP